MYADFFLRKPRNRSTFMVMCRFCTLNNEYLKKVFGAAFQGSNTMPSVIQKFTEVKLLGFFVVPAAHNLIQANTWYIQHVSAFYIGKGRVDVDQMQTTIQRLMLKGECVSYLQVSLHKVEQICLPTLNCPSIQIAGLPWKIGCRGIV